MQRFHFPLEQALRYKERRERLAEIRQLQASAEKLKRDAEVKRLRKLIDDTAAHLQSQMGKPVNLSTWFATLSRSEQLGKELQAALLEAQQAGEKLRMAQDQYKQAAQEAEALRTLRANKHQVHRADVAKAEQNFLEEMALFRWQNADEELGGSAS